MILAYLDPGTSSYALQIVAAFIVGAAFAIKTFWGKLKALLASLLRQRKKEQRPSERS